MKNFLVILLLLISLPALATGPAPGSNGQVIVNKNNLYGAVPPGNCISTNNTIDVASGPVRAGISTTDSISASDKCKYVTYTAASNISIPAAGTTGFTSQFAVTLKNTAGSGNLVLTPGSPSTCNGASTCTIPPGTQAYVYSDGTNYQIDYPNNLPVAISTLPSSLITKIAGFSKDGGGQVIPTGAAGCSPTFTYYATITGYDATLDITGSVVIGIWKTNGSVPTAGNSIVGSNPPTLSSARAFSPLINTSTTGWSTVSISPNDKICWNVNSASTATHLDFALYGTVTQ